jgi:ketosteroid isomerase-like protein
MKNRTCRSFSWVRSGLAAVALAAMTAGAAAPAYAAKSQKMTNEQIVKEIEKLEIRIVKAHDYKDFVELFDKDIQYWFASYYSKGFDNFLKDSTILFPNVDNWDVPILDMHIVATDNMAAATSMQVWNSTYADTQKPGIRTFYRQTNVWMKKPDGKWKVVQSHISLPIDPLTERVLCLDKGGYCALPNFPQRSLDANAIRKRNDAEASYYNPPPYQEGEYKPGD